VPFLPRTLRNFQLVPVVMGEADPAQAARVLAARADDKTLIVASSDLSHYHPYEEAQGLDRHCIRSICALDVAAMEKEEACGRTPILTLLHLARLKGWKPALLDYRNSGDTAGSKEGVVGYAAVVFTEPAEVGLSVAEKRLLLELARKTVREVVEHGRLPEFATDGLAPALAETKGCFVTLTEGGRLRGCIGHILPQEPLYRAVMSNARSAAVADARFEPVRPGELGRLEFEISVLTVPKPLKFDSPDDLLAKLRPREDGVVLQLGERGATYLPQVWEQLRDKVEFLDSLAVKAGGAPGDWRRPGTTVLIYQVEAFKEAEL
jgi:MEMO1 family protein